jgi:hypothetical protein
MTRTIKLGDGLQTYCYFALRSWACRLAEGDEMLRMETIDSLEGYQSVYLGD